MIDLGNVVSGVQRNLTRYGILIFIFWATFSAYYPFLIVYLISKGLDNTSIGAIISVNSLIVVIAQPFWGMVSDRTGSTKKVFLSCFVTASILIISLPFVKPVTGTVILLSILTFFESPLGPLLDSWLIQGVKAEGSTFGSIRFWGSVGFACMAYVNGRLIDKMGILITFLSFFIFAIFTIFACISIRESKRKTPQSLDASPKSNAGFIGLLKNYDYITFLVFASILFIPHKSIFTFLPKLIDFLGASKEYVGLAFSVVALGEIPFFIFSSMLISRFKPMHLILMSTVFFTLRQLLLSFVTSPIQVVLIQLLQGPSFALFLTGAVYYIDSLTPPGFKATAQTLGSAVFFGASGIIGSYGGGWFIDHFGLMSMYRTGTFICLGITVLFIISKRFSRTFAAAKDELPPGFQ